MPTLRQGRVRPITGEIFFCSQTANEPDAALLAELRSLGVAGVDDITGAENVDTSQELYDDSAYYDRSFVINATLSGLTVNALVSNAYTGPEYSSAGSFPPITVAAIVDDSSTRQLVGHPIMVYLIPQIVYVTYPASLVFGGIFLDNYPLNRTNFRMVRGIQNEINFYVRDVDRKPVALGMSETLTINILDLATNTLLMSRNLTIIDSTQGIYLLTVLPSEMDTWPTASMRWSLSYNRADGSTVLMWTDRGYSPYSTCTITEGPVPGPAPTILCVLTMMSDTNLYSQTLPGADAHGFVGGMQTFAITMTGFTGLIIIEGSLVTAPVNSPSSGDWFEIDLQTYTDDTQMVVLNETGNFLWMRVVVIPTSGTINQVQYKA